METSQKKETKCKNCGKESDILVKNLCVNCFEKTEKEMEKAYPLDKYEFEEDEYERLQEDLINKDTNSNKCEMVVHGKIGGADTMKLNQERALEKIIKTKKAQKK